MELHKLKIAFLAIVLFSFAVTANYNCPLICKCDMSAGLRRVQCVDQRLTSLEADIPGPVQFLDLSNNAIATLPDYGFMVLNMVQLIVVNISTNMLHTISLRAFYDLHQLQTVDLSNNLLHTLAPDLFENNARLSQLILSGNKYLLSQRSDTFLQSTSIQILDISKCMISYLHPKIFTKLPNITTLDISNNLLIELDLDVLVNLSKLKKLKLTANALACNDKLATLKMYLNQKHISYNQPCGTIEKSQRMEDEAQEVKEPVLWLHSDDDIDIQPTEMSDQNKYTCTTVNKTFFDRSLLLFILTFAVGFVFGVSVSCFTIHFMRITKRVRVRRLPKQSEYLLNEFNDIPCGMSTPVLNRVQRMR